MSTKSCPVHFGVWGEVGGHEPDNEPDRFEREPDTNRTRNRTPRTEPDKPPAYKAGCPVSPTRVERYEMMRPETWVQQYGERMQPGPDGRPAVMTDENRQTRSLLVQWHPEDFWANYRETADGRLWRKVR